VTPKSLFVIGSMTIVIGLVWYILSGVRSFLAPPLLAIDQPKSDIKVTTSSLVVAGQTDPAASLTINGEAVTVNFDGTFKQEIAIIPGLNTLEFVAINRVAKETKQIRKVLAEYQITPTPVPSPLVTPSGVTPAPTAGPSASPSPVSKRASPLPDRSELPTAQPSPSQPSDAGSSN
jgi:hypothetical protein